MESPYNRGQGKGKAADQSTPWSENIWDSRRFWYSHRQGPTGQAEYRYIPPNPSSGLPAQGAHIYTDSPYPSEYYATQANHTFGISEGSAVNNYYSSAVGSGFNTSTRTTDSEYPVSSLTTDFSNLYTDPPNQVTYEGYGGAQYVGGSATFSPQEGPESEFHPIEEPSHFFKVGLVFKAPWTEPAGNVSEREARYVGDSEFAQKPFTKVCQFIVAREMPGYSLCLPLNTPNGQASTKPGVRSQDYAVVYPVGGQAEYKPNERLDNEPLPIKIEEPGERIDPMSRLNFGSVYTVEHNVNVQKIGRVPDESLPLLNDYFVKTIAGSETGNPGSSIPETSYSGHIRMAPNSASYEELDPRYKEVDPKKQQKFWKVGRVFMMLWTEPARSTFGGTRNETHFSTVYLGGGAYSEIRRFVVVSAGYGNSICSPIHSYGGEATLKPNLPDPDQHAIIYTSSKVPGEKWYYAHDGTVVRENLTKEPIRVRREQSGPEGDLGDAARINYSKIYTVENYARVLNIGVVHPNSMQELIDNCLVRQRDEPPQGPRVNPPRPRLRKAASDDKRNGAVHEKGRRERG